jgi:hypothetical protein
MHIAEKYALSSHKIRFWSVNALARATGGDIQTVMYAAGHVDKNTTLHYIRLFSQMHRWIG